MSPAPQPQPPSSDERPKLRLRDVAPAATVTVPDSLKAQSGEAGRKAKPINTHKGGHPPLRILRFKRAAAWLTFLVIGGTLGAMRYMDWLPDIGEMIFPYGPYVILALNFIIVVLAAREDLFTGALCLLIPGYSLFYLLTRSGQAFLIALTCGLLVGFGQDSWDHLHEFAMDTHEVITKKLAGNR